MTIPIARAVLDVNRAPDDLPPENPDGVIKMTTAQGKSVYTESNYPEENTIDILLKKYYYPYHNRITSILIRHDIKLALDCHTMLEYAPSADRNPGQTRPLVCLSNGGDEKGRPGKKGVSVTCSPEWIQTLARSFRNVFGAEGKVVMNNPFSGGYTSQYHYHNSHVPWVQIELNRRLYLSACYFNAGRLSVKRSRIKELRDQVFIAIEHFWSVVS